MRAYYFTGLQFAINNIALQRLKVSRYGDLNDPFELLGVNLADRHDRKAFRGLKEHMDKEQGVICFSKHWSNPLLWGHYAEKHTGIALGFDLQERCALPVIYAERLADSIVNPKSGLPPPELVDKLVRTKFRDWKYEDEVRMCVSLDHKTAESGLYFMPFSADLVLREVVLGPKCGLPISTARELVRSFSPKVRVTKARIAFTRFEVLTNKVATRADREA